MELKIKNGDYVADGAGGLESVGGGEELLQRVLYRLTVRRGTFPFLPTLGSRLHTLARVRPPQRAAAAKQYVTEALAEETKLQVTEVSYAESAAESLGEVTASLRYGGEDFSITMEVQ